MEESERNNYIYEEIPDEKQNNKLYSYINDNNNSVNEICFSDKNIPFVSKNENNIIEEKDTFKASTFKSPSHKKLIPKQKPITEIYYIKDLKEFIPEEYSFRKYDKTNIEFGKKFYVYRFIKKKLEKSAENKDLRETILFNSMYENIKFKRNTIASSKSNHMGINMIKSEEMFNNKTEYRKYNSLFLLLLEKSIFTFNLKKYDESYNILLQENIINSKEEFGEFLLVVNGYNKYILGTFLAKDKPPNDQKEIINGFINSIDLKFLQKSKTNDFLECFRFLLSRIQLPEDSNLILQLMEVYSNGIFNTNKDNKDFISKYSSVNSIYLLISTILALNTMFTRKDIKNMNIIKKKQKVEMNNEIDAIEAQNIYEELEKNPISMIDNYSENNYKRMTLLVKKKIS